MDKDARTRAGSPARAFVCVGAEETEYLRAGCGAVVVLLTAEFDNPAALALIALLSAGFLVISPRIPRGVVFANWLSNVMDGLGFARVSIVAETPFVAEVLRFAADDEARVHRVAVLAVRSETEEVLRFLLGDVS
jgi:hypothetical protein